MSDDPARFGEPAAARDVPGRGAGVRPRAVRHRRGAGGQVRLLQGAARQGRHALPAGGLRTCARVLLQVICNGQE